MRPSRHTGWLTIALVAAAASAQVRADSVRAPAAPAAAVQPVYTDSMRSLMESADRLRASIAALAHKPPGEERDIAIGQARQALMKTQQAMLDLPPEYRSYGSQASTSGYDASVQSLMAAADALRHSVQSMAQQPAGPGRAQAIRDANRALLQTQVAMANAYDATAFPDRTRTMGAGAATTLTPARCSRLPSSMWACR